jgi:CheY-like chemotaxis protein
MMQQPVQPQPVPGMVAPEQAMPGQPVMPRPQVMQPAPAPAEPQVQFFPANSPTSQVQFFPADNMQQPAMPGQPMMQPQPGYGMPQAPAAQPAGPKEGTILIVDDSNLVVNFVKKIFDARYNVMIANDGAKAIELLDQEDIRKDIKACLLDLNMPNVDGYQVLEHCKQKGYFVRMPVAVESGVEDMASLDRVNAYPIVDVLSKPFNERDVQRVIEKCLATYF